MTSAPAERHIWVWYSPYGMGGVETYLLNMVTETVLAGGQVWVAATKIAEGPLRQQFLEAGAQLLDWTGFHTAFMSTEPAAAIQAHLIADLKRIQPTLLAVNDCNEFSIGAAPLLRRAQPYCTILDTFHIDSPDGQYLDFRRSFVDTLDGIAATNQNIVDRFRSRYPDERMLEVRYIPNGVRVHDRQRSPTDDTLRLLYVGRLAQDQKRILDLPALLQQLRARGVDFTMTIVGDGPARASLSAHLAAHALGDRVHLTGYLPPQEVAALYFDHDVLVNLSTFEGFSMSVLEALAAGCVPVCTDVASLDRAIFVDGTNCRLCPVDQLQGMVDLWAGLTSDSLRRMSIAARATGHRFTARQTYLAYAALIDGLRSRRPLRPWPAHGGATLDMEWDLSQHNPWLARPHRLRVLAQSLWARILRT